MKKGSIIIAIVTSLSLLLAVTACKTGLNESQKEIEKQEVKETGSAAFSIVIPDYYAMANLGRAIAPQSTKIRLSYKKFSTGTWVEHDTVNLTDAEKTVIEDAPEGFAGSVYKCVFTNIPSGNYSSGCMKIDLLDASDNVVSSGKNSDVVSIMMGEKTTAAFYTIPASSDAEDGSLAAGEMKFLKMDFDEDFLCTVVLKDITDLLAFSDSDLFPEINTNTDDRDEK